MKLSKSSRRLAKARNRERMNVMIISQLRKFYLPGGSSRFKPDDETAGDNHGIYDLYLFEVKRIG